MAEVAAWRLTAAPVISAMRTASLDAPAPQAELGGAAETIESELPRLGQADQTAEEEGEMLLPRATRPVPQELS